MSLLLAPFSILGKTAFNLAAGDETYVLDIVAAPGSPDLLAASASNHQIKIYDRSRLALKSVVQAHTKRISSIAFSPASNDILFSSSEDGTIAMWDLRTSQAAQRFAHKRVPWHSCDINSTGTLLCGGSELVSQDAHLVFWDPRSTVPIIDLLEVHSDDITRVRFSQSHPARLVSGSTDGLVNVLDLTGLSPQTDTETCVVHTHNSASSISRVQFFGPSDEYVVAVTHTDDLMLAHSLPRDNDAPEEISIFRNIRETTAEMGAPVDYLIDTLYEPASGRLFAVGGTHEGTAVIFHVNKSSLSPAAVLQGGHASMLRSVVWHPDTHSIVTGGEDAMLCLWSSAVPAPAAASSAAELRMHSPSHAQSYKPY
eukprot:m.82827 g.82827  ORF g.82827 m.82827 type:complete len:369 (-) comp8139_c0_seq2:586-1692(-)